MSSGWICSVRSGLPSAAAAVSACFEPLTNDAMLKTFALVPSGAGTPLYTVSGVGAWFAGVWSITTIGAGHMPVGSAVLVSVACQLAVVGSAFCAKNSTSSNLLPLGPLSGVALTGT